MKDGITENEKNLRAVLDRVNRSCHFASFGHDIKYKKMRVTPNLALDHNSGKIFAAFQQALKYFKIPFHIQDKHGMHPGYTEVDLNNAPNVSFDGFMRKLENLHQIIEKLNTEQSKGLHFARYKKENKENWRQGIIHIINTDSSNTSIVDAGKNSGILTIKFHGEDTNHIERHKKTMQKTLKQLHLPHRLVGDTVQIHLSNLKEFNRELLATFAASYRINLKHSSKKSTSNLRHQDENFTQEYIIDGKPHAPLTLGLDFVSTRSTNFIFQPDLSGCEAFTMDTAAPIFSTILANVSKTNMPHRDWTFQGLAFSGIITKLKQLSPNANSSEIDAFKAQEQVNQCKINPVLPIETLINKQMLVCRHYSSMAAILIAKLVKNKQLPHGSVRVYTTNTVDNTTSKINGAHAVCLYRNFQNNTLWLIDPLNDIVAPLENEPEFSDMEKEIFSKMIEISISLMGSLVIEEMLERSEDLDSELKRVQVLTKTDRALVLTQPVETDINPVSSGENIALPAPKARVRNA